MTETGKRPRGRPSTYSAAVIDKAIDYLNNYEEYGDPVPIAAGFADHIGISRSTLYKWAGEHEDLSDMLCAIQTRQERGLCAGGLKSDYSAVITKLMLSKHGYSDKQILSGPEDGPIEVKTDMVEVARRVAFLLNQGIKEE